MLCLCALVHWFLWFIYIWCIAMHFYYWYVQVDKTSCRENKILNIYQQMKIIVSQIELKTMQIKIYTTAIFSQESNNKVDYRKWPVQYH